MKDEPPPCEHVLFLFMSNPFEFIYTATACADIVDEAMKAFEESSDGTDEETELSDDVDPVVFALERLRVGKPGSSVLGFLINMDLPMEGETVGVAFDFDPGGSREYTPEVQLP